MIAPVMSGPTTWRSAVRPCQDGRKTSREHFSLRPKRKASRTLPREGVQLPYSPASARRRFSPAPSPSGTWMKATFVQ